MENYMQLISAVAFELLHYKFNLSKCLKKFSVAHALKKFVHPSSIFFLNYYKWELSLSPKKCAFPFIKNFFKTGLNGSVINYTNVLFR
jgi:hypothetical protein